MAMKIGLLDVDGHNFPNLALMKLSAYHKAKGDDVDWYTPFSQYDRVYMSKVFSNTPDYGLCINNAKEVIKGGTGYAIHGAGGEHYCVEQDKPLPYEIEHAYPDYDLYGIRDTAYGFLTRGCPRGCQFCIVAKKEGRMSVKVADLSEFWGGRKTSFSTIQTFLLAEIGRNCLCNLKKARQTLTSTKDWMQEC